jgi:hypothetical protein
MTVLPFRRMSGFSQMPWLAFMLSVYISASVAASMHIFYQLRGERPPDMVMSICQSPGLRGGKSWARAITLSARQSTSDAISADTGFGGIMFRTCLKVIAW